jgi:hypothetical protein
MYIYMYMCVCVCISMRRSSRMIINKELDWAWGKVLAQFWVLSSHLYVGYRQYGDRYTNSRPVAYEWVLPTASRRSVRASVAVNCFSQGYCYCCCSCSFVIVLRVALWSFGNMKCTWRTVRLCSESMPLRRIDTMTPSVTTRSEMVNPQDVWHRVCVK